MLRPCIFVYVGEGMVDTDRGTRDRVQIFIDFWNFTLSLSAMEAGFKPDWLALPRLVMREVQSLDPSPQPTPCHFSGVRIYGSFDDAKPADEKLRRWATNFLARRLAGGTVVFVPRQRKHRGPGCPQCQAVVEVCSQCGADMRGTEEKGVDTRIATDMISLAWEDAYDTAVLISADRDFVPVVEFLKTKGKRIIHGAFPPKGAALQEACWGQINLTALAGELRREA